MSLPKDFASSHFQFLWRWSVILTGEGDHSSLESKISYMILWFSKKWILNCNDFHRITIQLWMIIQMIDWISKEVLSHHNRGVKKRNWCLREYSSWIWTKSRFFKVFMWIPTLKTWNLKKSLEIWSEATLSNLKVCWR
jgi:hypothetical protein